tara:strand:- start:63 stop:491 length:429 start_codon:yes stop_codon:yes gene_type:complete
MLLKLWLGDQFNQDIVDLTKIFSLSVIFGCSSHILVTKFEASQILKENLKFETILLPFFLVCIFLLIFKSFPLFVISLAILGKEIILLMFRINFLKKEIINVKKYYYYLLAFTLMLFFSFYSQILFFLLEAILIIILTKYDK